MAITLLDQDAGGTNGGTVSEEDYLMSSGTDRMLLGFSCLQGVNSAATVTAASFGTQNFTQIALLNEVTGNGNICIYAGRIMDADIPSNLQTMSFTWSTIQVRQDWWILLEGVDQSNPIVTSAFDGSGNTDPNTLSLTGMQDGHWVLTVGGQNTTTAITIPTDYTASNPAFWPPNSARFQGAYRALTTTATENLTFTGFVGTRRGQIAVGVRNATAAGPTLTVPTASSVTTTGCTPQVTTDTGNGTLYQVCTAQGDNPSVAQIIAGQQSNGTAAPASANQAVSATGVQTMAAVTTLQHSVNYSVYFAHRDASSNDSASVFANFTTLTDPAMVLTSPTALNPTATTVTPRVTANEAGGTIYAYAVAGSSQTPNHATIVANAQQTGASADGVVTLNNITGLAAGSDFTLAFTAVDGANPSNASTPVYVNFSTVALVANVELRNVTDGTLFANQTNVQYAVWNEAALASLGAPVVQANNGTTDANGILTVNYGSALNDNGIVLARVVVAGADNTNDNWAAGGILAE